MRAWTIVLFIIAFHACLSMFAYVDLQNSLGLNITIDTTSKTGNWIITPGTTNITIPSSDPYFFDSTSNGSVNNSAIKPNDFVGNMIESVLGVANAFGKLMGSFTQAAFAIHTYGAPYFGDGPAWILEGVVDFVIAIGFFQLVTGRGFKVLD